MRVLVDTSAWVDFFNDFDSQEADSLAGLSRVTSVPHSSSGARVSAQGQLVEPAVLASQGGNVAGVDGSVEWRDQDSMRPHFVVYRPPFTSFNSNPSYIGYW